MVEYGKCFISGIDFRMNRGETLAIIGAAGSGKSTLVGLMDRVYDATRVCTRRAGISRISAIPLYAWGFNGP